MKKSVSFCANASFHQHLPRKGKGFCAKNAKNVWINIENCAVL
jgi:hypothetical protein